MKSDKADTLKCLDQVTKFTLFKAAILQNSSILSYRSAPAATSDPTLVRSSVPWDIKEMKN